YGYHHKLMLACNSGTIVKKLRCRDAPVLRSPSSYFAWAATMSANSAASRSTLTANAPIGVVPHCHSLPMPTCTPYSRFDTTLLYVAWSVELAARLTFSSTVRHLKRSQNHTMRGPNRP